MAQHLFVTFVEGTAKFFEGAVRRNPAKRKRLGAGCVRALTGRGVRLVCVSVCALEIFDRSH